ncbi:MAG: PLDc_N domain-containing protein [Cyclobacteriaceae bacterium]|nr:PLDc_N domain-containing protein [Cyclobacteriaceae bacterium]
MVRIWGLLILVIAILAVIDVWKRADSMEKRLLWTVVIILLPIVGPLAWYAISRGIIKL